MFRQLRGELSVQTASEKQAVVQGANLFFGALLGVNLATTGSLPIDDYALLIVLLAGTVGTLTIFSQSERRVYAWALLGTYVALVAFVFLVPSSLLASYIWHDRQRLLVTLTIWIGMVVLIEFIRVRPD